MVVALRDYSDDWRARLRFAPNHAFHHGFVQLIGSKSDDELLDWIIQSIR
jgi:hypothetical protein